MEGAVRAQPEEELTTSCSYEDAVNCRNGSFFSSSAWRFGAKLEDRPGKKRGEKMVGGASQEETK